MFQAVIKIANGESDKVAKKSFRSALKTRLADKGKHKTGNPKEDNPKRRMKMIFKSAPGNSLKN